MFRGNMTISEDNICPKCQYPMWPNEVSCLNCVEIKRSRDEEEANKKRMEQEKVELDTMKLGGGRAYSQFTAENFKATKETEAALSAAVNFDFKKENLYFHGPTGCGKSHLAAIAARKFLDKSVVRTIRVSDLARDIRACESAEKEIEIIEYLASADVLVLDDLGVEKITEFVFGIIYSIIDKRYQDKPYGLIITSNLFLAELSEKFGEDRVASRLAQMCKIFHVAGKDWRISGKS